MTADTPSEDEELAEFKAAIEAKNAIARYADFFEWPDRTVKERGITRVLLEELDSQSGLGLQHVRSRPPGQDPPDCEAEATDGSLVGIEITELVDQHTVKRHAQGDRREWAAWSPEMLREHVAARLVRKDDPGALKGGPYSRYILIIHTDEPNLTGPFLRIALGTHRFRTPRLITEAFVLARYDPHEKGYPFVALSWSPDA